MRYFEDQANLLLQYKLYRISENSREVTSLKLSDFQECSYGKDVLNLLISLSEQGIIVIRNVKIDNKYLELKRKLEDQKAKEAINIGSYGERRTAAYDYFGISEELYKKISKKKSINFSEWKIIYEKSGRFADDYIVFDVSLDRMKIKEFLDGYITDFIKGEVVENKVKNNFSYYNQMRAVKRTLGRLANIHGSKNVAITASDIWSEDFTKNSASHKLAQSQTNFIEVFLSMEKLNIIKIENFFNDYSARVSILPCKEINYPDVYTKVFDDIALRLFQANQWRERMEKQSRPQQNKELDSQGDIIVVYGNIKLDGTTGRCWRNGDFVKKFYTSKAPFKILRLLLMAKGELVSYDRFKKGVEDLPTGKKEAKEFIRRAIKGLRSSFGINMEKNPEDNIFEWTGDGFFIKNIPSK